MGGFKLFLSKEEQEWFIRNRQNIIQEIGLDFLLRL